jgi:hypothetical protein
MNIQEIQTAIDILRTNANRSSEKGHRRLDRIIEKIQDILDKETKYIPLPNSLENFRKLIDEDQEYFPVRTCSYYRKYNSDDYLNQKFNEAGIDFDTFKKFLESDECICGHCNENNSPQVNVVIFDKNRGLYREPTNNFIIRQESDGLICIIGKLNESNNEIVSLTTKEIEITRRLGLKDK